MKLQHFEKVIVVASKKFPADVGREGVVTGISEDDSVVHGYAVSFPGEPDGKFFFPGDLEGTGEFVDRSTIYDMGETMKVVVKDGRGSIEE